jgi:hypothetical protein
MARKKQTHPDIPISENAYRNMLRLGWCLKSVNSIVTLTPLGESEFIKACAKYRQELEIRPEWLAPD